jgi:metal iron transporter
MNCPLRADDGDGRQGWNQNPNSMDGTTRQDLNGMANTRVLRRVESHDPTLDEPDDEVLRAQRRRRNSTATIRVARTLTSQKQSDTCHVTRTSHEANEQPESSPNNDETCPNYMKKIRKVLMTFGKFVGPGFMVSAPFQSRLER